jgi:RNA polymerase sigma factor (sigma-70 family)
MHYREESINARGSLMANQQLASLVYQLRRSARHEENAESDGHLLGRFLAQKDHLAFATLLERHGPMVLGVCQRVLDHTHDAEDAFQATFLILARKASSIQRHPSVGSWLHGVALRVARRIRANRSRRQPECKELPMSGENPANEAARRELRALIDEELGRLPEKYRVPIVLCYLEGRTNAQAAQELGWSRGVIAGRLARARDLLRTRLARRGLGLSSGLLAVALSEEVAGAAPRATLIVSTVDAAAHFAAGGVASAGSVPAAVAEGVLHTMFLSKIKVVATVLLSVALLGGAVTSYSGYDSENERGKKPAPVAPAAGQDNQGRPNEVARLKKEIDRLRRELLKARAQAEAARAEAEVLRAEAIKQRDRALQAARQERQARERAEAARRQAQEALDRALKEASKSALQPVAALRKLLGVRAVEIIAGAEQVEVYRVEAERLPKGGRDKALGHYKIVARGKDQGKSFVAGLRATLFNEKTYLFEKSKDCKFTPEVGFRFRAGEESVDILLCFSCNQIRVLTMDGQGKETHFTQMDFDRARETWVKLAKSVFPEDRAIQALSVKR